MIYLLWAEDENGLIGKDMKLPWYLPNDLKYFKEHTTGKTILMGRKTFEGMGKKPLPNRKNIVLTRNRDLKAEGVEVIHSPKDLGQAAAPEDDLYVIGGTDIFRLFIDQADVLLQTKIFHRFEGDTFFPAIDWEKWELVETIPGTVDEKNTYAHEFRKYIRKAQN